MNKEIVNNAKFIQLLLSIEYYRGNESYEIKYLYYYFFSFLNLIFSSNYVLILAATQLEVTETLW